ncbi:MAG TPA: hypothetical protein VN408_09045 [Actinoplanes sp.]|nr:hypothetical protein [Actinoplanes sp.]
MPIHALRSQEAQHDSGAVVRSHGRDAVQFQLHGRVMTINVERGVGSDTFFLPTELRWDDETPLDAEAAALVRPVLQETNSFWGSESEFHETGRRRPGRSVWTD